MLRLAEEIDRYGEDIEFDLREIWQVDLTDFFHPDPEQRRTPRQLRAFIDRLPKNSHYWTARSQDVDLHRAHHKRTKGARRKPDPPRMYEYSPELEALSAVIVHLQQIVHVLQYQNAPKGKQKKFKAQPWPVPETATDLLRKEEAREAHRHLDEVVKFVPQDEWEAENERRRSSD